MAHIKASATTKGNRDSVAKRLGIKIYAGQKVQPGSILVRQRGTKFSAGNGTKMGGDNTLYSIQTGVAKFTQKLGKKYIEIIHG